MTTGRINENNNSDSIKNKRNTTSSPQMVTIPAGPFLMGTSDKQVAYLVSNEDWATEWKQDDLFQVEQPQHTVTLPEYQIGIVPVSNSEYHTFVFSTGYRVPKNWIGFSFPEGEGNNPITGVSKIDAIAYCQWLSKIEGIEYRLPNEAEWEKAARGTDGRIYPWGDNFDPWRCNTLESAKHTTTPNGSYSPGGDSVYGVMDMVGNVWEWTSSFLVPYPYSGDTVKDNEKINLRCIVRGGAWYYTHKLARCATRENVLSDYVSTSLGFRIAH